MSTLAEDLPNSLQRSLQLLQQRSQNWSPRVLEQARQTICGSRELPMFDPRASSRLDEAVDRLLAGGAAGVAARDHVVLAYNLAEPHPNLDGNSLLNTTAELIPLLGRWRMLLGTRGSYRQIWRGALLSLFRGAPEDAGFEATRRFLADTIGVLRAGKFHPAWLDAMERHPRLLAQNPVSSYALAWLEGHREGIEEVRELIELPPRSWFWSHLIEAIVEACCGTSNDALFDERWPVVVKLIDDHPYCRDLVLGRVLSRYAKKSAPLRENHLLQVSLGAWGSPELGADVVGRWSDTSDDARAMVCGWLAEEDLEDFATYCKGDSTVDARRLSYWLRFKKQISFSRLVLGSSIRDAQDMASRDFIARKKGRVAYLHGPSNNNAIILRIGAWWFVEFSEKGNACYPYADHLKPFNAARKEFNAADLRDAIAMENGGGRRLIHRDTKEGLWESAKFDPFLSEQGIWPDAVGRPPSRVAASVATTRPRSDTAIRPHSATAPVGALASLGLSESLLNDLRPFKPRVVDNRSKRGALWIELARAPGSELLRSMERQGFRYAKGRGFYKQ
ncbi:EH signature domain-containing protein [Frateuria hangzhouensis]|uniref:EH signature domain-containing protein n=1 Tax=Frateuria hangzhouensis TaxID=2995589 RepID=UPI002260E87C|nr:EH signature domain-containing protein [Frateuria sp. STR12]MCX7512579.1 EH signature domain-containing protein [Frateuria sp. STR12]